VAAVTASVTSRDRGLAGVLRALQDLDSLEVAVGVLADDKGDAAHAGTALTVLTLAEIHEFGAPAAGIPQRSFLRATIDEHAEEIRALQQTLLGQVVGGRLSVEQALARLGAFVVGLIQARIAAGIAPPNAPETVARKGSATPLVDTGQLRASVTYVVRPRGGGG
jgi:hypothetical protein